MNENLTIGLYTRNLYLTHIRPLYIKSECENCGDIEKLELHHEEEHFATMLNKAHKIGNVERKQYTSEYTKDDLNKVRYLLLGLHVSKKYKTLCKSCHDKEHEKTGYDMKAYYEYVERRRKKKEADRKHKLENELLPYLKDNVGTIFYGRAERDYFISLVNVRDVKDRLLKGIRHINNLLKDYDYEVIVKDIKSKVNNKRYRNAWVITKIK